ncbi:hypothetical protein HMPREF9137_2176 [Prevotella denticola F0289]|nr:hypothetical protein HMPREF9137_2176 [Prevotella denticola F0289]
MPAEAGQDKAPLPFSAVYHPSVRPVSICFSAFIYISLLSGKRGGNFWCQHLLLLYI